MNSTIRPINTDLRLSLVTAAVITIAPTATLSA